MADVLLDRKTRRKIADFLRGKKRPHKIKLETWYRILRGEQSSIALNDLQVIQNYYRHIRSYRVLVRSVMISVIMELM